MLGPTADLFYTALLNVFSKSIGQCAATQTYLAVHPGAGGVSGEYWEDVNIGKSSAHGQDDELANKLWAHTEELANRLLEASATTAGMSSARSERSLVA